MIRKKLKKNMALLLVFSLIMTNPGPDSWAAENLGSVENRSVYCLDGGDISASARDAVLNDMDRTITREDAELLGIPLADDQSLYEFNGEILDNYANPGTILYTPRRNANTATLALNMDELGGGTFISTRQGANATLTWDPGMTSGTINFNGLGVVAGETFTRSNDGAFQKVQFEYKRATPDANPAPTVTP